LSDSLLSLKMKHRVGGVSLNVAFTLTQPWTVLFGPSGSGKTTVLRAIAGFVRPEEGRIVKHGDVLMDSTTGEFVPPHQRLVRSAAQTAWLFPQQDVSSNLAYGSGWRSKPGDVAKIIQEVLSLFHLEGLGDRRPSALSGGEKQRIAVARAVVSAVTWDHAKPPLLLLDEPFTGLDAALRDDLLLGLRQRLEEWRIPVLSVTHALGEAFQLDAEVIKIADGRVIEQGPVTNVLAEERERLLTSLRVVKG
jgi:molybdate transport system ATP-binding protein